MNALARTPRWTIALAPALALALAAHPAQACGGFFCNRPATPTDLPVAQTGENVLFVMDPDPATGLNKLVAHIQIQYTGPADKFSWVVPVDALPTVELGSDRIFQAIDRATRPKFMLTRRIEGVCSDDSPSFGLGGSTTKASDRGGVDASDGNGGVKIDFHADVGPFDAKVVHADEPGALKAWLAENNYYLSDEGSRLIDDYAKEQKFFVALKLLNGASVNQIQPIVLRFTAASPCVPLRLTAIAALDDLRVNLWVLAGHRVVPQNYFEIKLNDAKLDWLNNGRNYQDLLKTAANEAGGNAFAVEYAGTPQVLAANPLLATNDLSGVRATTNVFEARTVLMSLGYLPDPSVERALAVHSNPFDAAALVTDIEKNVVQPLRDANAAIASHAKLTRLVTFISPAEMTSDPTFIENSTLPDVSNVRAAFQTFVCGARAYKRCNAPMRIDLADGQKLWYRAPADDSGWCNVQRTNELPAGFTSMPSLERGWSRTAEGEGALRFDNRNVIAAAVAAEESAINGGCSCALGGRGRAPGVALVFAALAFVFARRRWRR